MMHDEMKSLLTAAMEQGAEYNRAWVGFDEIWGQWIIDGRVDADLVADLVLKALEARGNA